MRTPGFGLSRRSSTSGVWPIAWTMSPYLPPHGRLSRRGSNTSKSVARYPASAYLPGDEMRKILMALALALALAGCGTTQNKNQKDYPPEAKENFVTACVDSASGDKN